MDLIRPKLLALMRDLLSTRPEMVHDLLAVVLTFSCRLPGLCRFEQGITSDALVGGPA